MKRTYSQIGLDERRKIARWRQAGGSVDVIAENLGRHPPALRAAVDNSSVRPALAEEPARCLS